MNCLAPWLAVLLCSRVATAQTDTSASGRLASRNAELRSRDRAGRDARNAADWSLARLQYGQIDSLLGGHPGAKLAMARASIWLNDTATAVRHLEAIGRMGLTVDLASDSVLRGVRARYPQLARTLDDNTTSIGRRTLAAEMPMPDFVAEGVAYDPTGRRILVSSIRHGVVTQTASGASGTAYIDLVRDGGWSGLGLAVDSSRNRLWVTTMWYAHGIGVAPADSGRSAVHLYDLARGVLVRRFELPRGAHEPGDVCLAPNGDLFVSDGRDGSIRVIRNGVDTLATLVPAGLIFSPQGCAVDGSHSRLFVADYANGIVAVDLATSNVAIVARPSFTAVNGIDGLTIRGNCLFGVQNGVNPNRILAMRLDHGHTGIAAVMVLARDTARITSPTHVITIGTDVLFVENSGFPNYDVKGKLLPGRIDVAPRIARVSLASSNQC